jgi:hypothetical protein
MDFPWVWEYLDSGIDWQDFVARVNLTGEDSGGTRYYGWARLAASAMRNKLGNRDVNITTYIDNAANLQTAARRLLAYVGEPGYLLLKQIRVSVELLYATHDAAATADPEAEAFTAAALFPGDKINFGAPTYPATLSAQREADLDTLWQPTVADNGTGGTITDFTVKTVTREWNPTGGWFVTYGIEPDPTAALNGLLGSDISDYGNGTY